MVIKSILDDPELVTQLDTVLDDLVGAYTALRAHASEPDERFRLSSQLIRTIERWNALRYGLLQEQIRRREA